MHSISRTSDGIWILTDPVLSVDCDLVGEIGRSILECLSASVQGIPNPSSVKGLTDSLLKLAGVRSFNAFAKPAISVGIRMDSEIITLTPTRNEGPRGGFVHLNEKDQVAGGSEEALGSATIAAFALCE